MKPKIWLPVVLAGIAVSLSSAIHSLDGGTVVIAVVIGAVVGLVLAAMVGSTSGRHKALVKAHPGAQVIEVWAAAGTYRGLAALGADTSGVRKGQGTALSMVLEPHAIELWRGSKPRLLVTVPWTDLVGAFPAEGVVANNGPRPAMTLLTRGGAEITVCPAAQPTGSLRTASGAKTQELVDQVNARVESLRHP